jgi:hypothetical protein
MLFIICVMFFLGYFYDLYRWGALLIPVYRSMFMSLILLIVISHNQKLKDFIASLADKLEGFIRKKLKIEKNGIKNLSDESLKLN